MKKLLILLIMSILSVLTGTVITSCDKLKCGSSSHSWSDSVKIATTVDQVLNPTFTSAQDFCDYALDEVSYYNFVSTCSRLHENTIQSIAFNILSTKKTLDYRAFMDEYTSNKLFYDNVDKVNKGIADKQSPTPPLTYDSVPTTRITINTEE